MFGLLKLLKVAGHVAKTQSNVVAAATSTLQRIQSNLDVMNANFAKVVANHAQTSAPHMFTQIVTNKKGTTFTRHVMSKGSKGKPAAATKGA